MIKSFKEFLNEEGPLDSPPAPVKLPIPWQYWEDFMPYWAPHPIFKPMPVDDDGNEVNPDGSPIEIEPFPDYDESPFGEPPYYFSIDTPWLKHGTTRDVLKQTMWNQPDSINIIPPTTG